MSHPLIPNKSKWQKVEHANTKMAKVFSPQPHSDNAFEHMAAEEYIRFVEKAESDRQFRMEDERKRRRRANLKLYSSMALGTISIFVSNTSYNTGNPSGWIAIIFGVAGIAFLMKYAVGPYGSSLGWKGIVGFCLSIWGIIVSIGAL